LSQRQTTHADKSEREVGKYSGLAETVCDQAQELEEIVLTAIESDACSAIGLNESDLESLKPFQVGTWVELTTEQSDVVHCKLASIVQPGDRCLFVNRRGMKVAERTQRTDPGPQERDD